MNKYFILSTLMIAIVVSTTDRVFSSGLVDGLNNINNTLYSVDNTIHRGINTYSNIENAAVNTTYKISNTSSNRVVQRIPGTGYSKVCENTKCGLLDNDENSLIIPIQYDDVKHMAKDTPYFKILSNGKYAIYNATFNKKISNFIYDDADIIFENSDHWIKVKQNGKWGVLDAYNRTETITCKYDKISSLNNRLFKIYSNNKVGIATPSAIGTIPAGAVLVPPQFNNVDYIGTHTVFKVNNGGKWAAYDTSRKAVVTGFNYDDIQPYYNDMLKIKQNGATEWTKIKY